MTAEEAIKTIQVAIAEVEWEYPLDYSVAFETAIEALEKQIPKKPIYEKCEDCLYEKICYMREISNDIKEEIKEFGCMNFIACADVREVKDDWEWKPRCKGEGDA